jgi:3-hydroxyacyl-[acyl-carrier-protein] dehydratase
MTVQIDSYSYLHQLVERLPQKPPFRFVDEITAVSDWGISGFYTFPEDAWYYRGHFPNHPVTPGVILLEAMAQIGVVGLWLHLKQYQYSPSSDHLSGEDVVPLFADATVDFLRSIYPGTRVRVDSQKIYFRRGKLCCDVSLFDSNGQVAARARISGQGVNHAK